MLSFKTRHAMSGELSTLLPAPRILRAPEKYMETHYSGGLKILTNSLTSRTFRTPLRMTEPTAELGRRSSHLETGKQ